MLISKHEGVGLKPLNDFKAFIELLNDMDDIYEDIEDYNPNKKCKTLIVFNDIIADMPRNEKLQ